MVRSFEIELENDVTLRAKHEKHGMDWVLTWLEAKRATRRCESEDVGLPTVPLGQVANGGLLFSVAGLAVRMVVSTGMSTFDELNRALRVIGQRLAGREATPDPERASTEEEREVLAERVTLLHCTMAYPTPYADVNLRAMDELADRFGVAVGLSDHTQGTTAAVAAAARGAVVVEKHFTTDNGLPGPDQAASLEPGDFRRMVEEIRIAEECLGEGVKGPTASERENVFPVRQGLVATRAVSRGEPWTPESLGTRRPAAGASPMLYWKYLDTPADRDYQSGEPVGS